MRFEEGIKRSTWVVAVSLGLIGAAYKYKTLESTDILHFAGLNTMNTQAIAKEIKNAYPVYADENDEKLAERYRAKYGIVGKMRVVFFGFSIGFLSIWFAFFVLRWIVKGFVS